MGQQAYPCSMSNSTPPTDDQLLAALIKALGAGPVPHVADSKLEERLGTRIDRLEQKIDAMITHTAQVTILQSKIDALEISKGIQENDIKTLSLQVEALKTWRTIVSAAVTLVGVPLSIFALTQLFQMATT